MTVAESSATDSSEPNLFVATIHFECGKFGAALYHNNQIQVLNEDSDKINRDLFDMLSLNESTLKVISSSRTNLVALRQCLAQGTVLELVPSIEFSLCSADELQDEFCVKINHHCTVENESCFKSLRALLSYLTKVLPVGQMPAQVTLLEIESTNVVISKNCLQALQIFDFEPHPNMHAANHGFKEGCSIFSLFNQAVSEEGRTKLKNWFQRPTSNIQLLQSRHDSIEALNQSEMAPFIKATTNSLKKCIRIGNVLNDLKFRPDANELMKIGRFCESFHEIHAQAVDGKVSSFPLIDIIRSTDFSAMFALSHLIRRIIDVESYKTSEIYTVRQHVSPELDALRRKYSNLPDFLTAAVSELAQGIDSANVEAINIVYFPQLGFLITLPLIPNGTDPTALGIELGFELQFQSDKICYYKNEKMKRNSNGWLNICEFLDLDETIGDVYADIIDAQLEIMNQIVDEAVKCEILLKEALDMCSELDCLIALAKTAQMYSLTRPEIVNDHSVLHVEDGRHLLVELYVNRHCIANDCNLTAEKRKMIITGANSSGKSVYLKQAGIITFLAHIGSFVPARSAKIGLVDRIATRIRTVESSGKGDSCFMIDLKQVKAICETATEKSLILIDEFGKGTSQNDGMALFSGFLNYFAKKPTRLLAITHMYEVFRSQLVDEVEEYYKFGHMKVFPDQSGLCYLYRLEEGLGTEQSFAIECARESGIPEKVLNDAKAFLQELKKGASPEDLKLLKTNEQDLNEAIQLIKSIE